LQAAKSPLRFTGAQQPRSASSSSSPDVETAHPRNPAARAPARRTRMDGRLNWMKTVHHTGCWIGLDENLHTNGWIIEVDESSNFNFYSILSSSSPPFEVVFPWFFNLIWKNWCF
jgi:hypothetical protein